MKYGKLVHLALAGVLGGTMLLAGCHHKPLAKAPQVPPPPPTAPTATIAASPEVVTAGQPTTVTWNTANADEINISGVGTVSASGSRQVTPGQSTTYALTAKGPGGTADANARVTVNAAKTLESPAISEEELFRKNVRDVFFGYDKYDVDTEGNDAAASTAKFMADRPNMKLLVEGHCDERGSIEYNLALGANRANAVKTELTKLGVSPDRIRTQSFGKEKPFCTDSTEECWAQNRRGHMVREQ
jgi:peptidoglycan-associated lipoprotein